jgi:hypothetical protein
MPFMSWLMIVSSAMSDLSAEVCLEKGEAGGIRIGWGGGGNIVVVVFIIFLIIFLFFFFFVFILRLFIFTFLFIVFVYLFFVLGKSDRTSPLGSRA